MSDEQTVAFKGTVKATDDKNGLAIFDVDPVVGKFSLAVVSRGVRGFEDIIDPETGKIYKTAKISGHGLIGGAREAIVATQIAVLRI